MSVTYKRAFILENKIFGINLTNFSAVSKILFSIKIASFLLQKIGKEVGENKQKSNNL